MALPDDLNASLPSPADIIAASGHVGYQWDLQTDRLVWFGAWQTLFGADRAAPPATMQEMADTVLSNDRHLVFNETAPIFDREFRFQAADGSLIWVHEHGTTDFESGHAVRQQGLLRAIEAPQQAGVSPYDTPDRDMLTGRPNRLCLLALIDKILKGPHETRAHSGYMVVGIDRLSFINEAMGTKTGDRLICAVADRLSALCPTRAIVGRVAGNVFGVLLPGVGREIDHLADRILADFHDHAFRTEETSLHLSVSVGSRRFSENTKDPAEVMIHAEQALLEARENGMASHVAYDEATRHCSENRNVLEIGERVKQALKDGTLRLAFQPVVNAQTGETEFYEVLSRLFDTDGQLMAAADFIPVVEQLGLAPDFDRYVFDLSIREMERCDTLKLAVNVSGLTAALPDWPSFVRSKLASKPHVARRMIIEITENAAVLDIAKIKCLVDSLRDMGSQVALDDFGAGSTSIRHLRDLSLAIMKIDKDLLSDILTSPEQQHLVRMLTSMAHGLGLRTVAEGIECEEVAAWLRRENTDMLQGYYTGRPSLERPWLDPKDKNAACPLHLVATDGSTACV